MTIIGLLGSVAVGQTPVSAQETQNKLLRELYRELSLEVSDLRSVLSRSDQEIARFTSESRVRITNQRIQTVQRILEEGNLPPRQERWLQDQHQAEQTVLRRQQMAQELSREELESRLDVATAALTDVAGELGHRSSLCVVALD